MRYFNKLAVMFKRRTNSHYWYNWCAQLLPLHIHKHSSICGTSIMATNHTRIHWHLLLFTFSRWRSLQFHIEQIHTVHIPVWAINVHLHQHNAIKSHNEVVIQSSPQIITQIELHFDILGILYLALLLLILSEMAKNDDDDAYTVSPFTLDPFIVILIIIK